jgi:DHA1 family multidrug resistance protein-like MFS transporter
MFNGMGINYAMTLLGCVAAVLVPLPICFYLYGPKLRRKSKFAPGLDLKWKAKKDAEARGESEQGVRRAEAEAAGDPDADIAPTGSKEEEEEAKEEVKED